MAQLSAGILLYRREEDGLWVLLVHPGGPFWARRDTGAWQIPKGLVEPGETPVSAALREFAEELGVKLDRTPVPLGSFRQAGGKQVEAFMLEADMDADRITANRFEIEWPPGSGKQQSFPEIDRAAWFPIDQARSKILPSQCIVLDLLAERFQQG